MNVAETSPFLRDAVDAYLEAYIDLAPRLGAEWIVVHAGYHFTADFERRKAAALARLQRAATLSTLTAMSEADFRRPSGVPYAPTVSALFLMQCTHWLMHAGQWAIIRRQLGRPPLF